MKPRDFFAGLMIASAMRHAVAEQPEKTKRITLAASVTKVSNMRAEKAWLCRAFSEGVEPAISRTEADGLTTPGESYAIESARPEIPRPRIGSSHVLRRESVTRATERRILF